MKRHFPRILLSAALLAAFCPVHAADNADNPIGRFDISRFQVEGNTLLPQQEVDDLLKPYAGKSRDFGDVQRALEALEAAFRDRGYNIVQVILPEQELNQGVVRFAVIQTRIGKVTVQGNKVFDAPNIRNSLPDLREGEVPNLKKVSAELRMANENPAKKTTLQLQSGSKDGEVDALLKVEDDKSWRVGANVDNSGTGTTGRTHIGFTYQNANLLNRDHVVSVQYTTTVEEPSKVSVWGAGYHIPLYALGDSLDLFASYSNVDSGTVAAGLVSLQVSGKGKVYGMRYNHNLARRGELAMKIVGGFDYKAFENNIDFVGTPLGSDVTVHPVTVGIVGSDVRQWGEYSFYGSIYRNLPGGSNGKQDDFTRVRASASDSYTMLRYGGSVVRLLPKDWQFRVALNGQYTSDALVPGEQFGAGGVTSVRGFAEREVANDTGALINLETYTPNLCSVSKTRPMLCRGVVFIDAAHLSRNHPLPSELDDITIAGAGFGYRMTLDKYLSMQFDYGRVIHGGGVRENGSSRMHFGLNLLY
jgi:hemolysin activation/secretion protein